jgi:4-amino-4-deoxy-L-arabinose transferase-like glycosyltransferase
MLHSGDWFVHTFNEQPDYWNAKPPLGFWAVAAGFRLFGFTPFGLRVISAGCSLITLLMIIAFARRHFSWPVALLSGAFFVTLTRFVIYHNVRSGDPDALFIMFSTGAIFAAFAASRKYVWTYLSAFLLALAFLSKSFHAAAPGAVVFFLLLFNQGRDALRPRRLVPFLLIGTAPILFWSLVRYACDGTAFFETMLFNDLGRSLKIVDEHSGPIYYYLKILDNDFRHLYIFYLSLLLFFIAWTRFRQKKIDILFYTPINNILYQTIVCAVIPLILFSLAVSKFRWYIYPTYPFIVIAFAVAIHKIGNTLIGLLPERWGRYVLPAFLAFFLLFLEARLLYRIARQAEQQNPVQVALYNAAAVGRKISVYLESEGWSQDLVLAAKLFGDFKPADGGRAAWEKDTDRNVLLVTENLSIASKK